MLYGYENRTGQNSQHLSIFLRLSLPLLNFQLNEIPFDKDGNLSLTEDPKEAWAKRHPECFPININRADRFKLMHIPGLGEVSVRRILNIRTSGGRVRRLEDLGNIGKRIKKVSGYISF